jgi:hypothetical protein
MNQTLVFSWAAILIAAQLNPNFPAGQIQSHPSTIIVTTISDSGPGSLRQAVADAASGDQIAFSSNLNGQVITLLSSLVIDENLAIIGPGSNLLTIQGAGVVGLLAIRGSVEVTVSGLTIRDGVRGVENQGGCLTIINSVITGNSAGPPWDGAGIFNKDGSLTLLTSQVIGNNVFNASGGGIANVNSTLTIIGSTISNNTAMFGGGAGVVNFSGSVVITNTTIRNNSGHGHGLRNDGTMSLTNSSVSNNTGGGGVYNFGGDLTITNSAIYSNTATYIDGGGINNSGILTVTNSTVSGNGSNLSGGGIYTEATLSLNNVTIAHNTADLDSNSTGDGGGISTSGSLYFKNSIVAENTDNGAVTARPDLICSGLVYSQGYNLIGNPTGCSFIPAPGDQHGTPSNPLDPRLGPLADNGSYSLTHALLEESPAIDSGNPASPGSGQNACEATDQRGVVRPEDGNEDGTSRCDIGAFEVILLSKTVFLPVTVR